MIHHLTTHTLSHHFKSSSVALPKIFRLVKWPKSRPDFRVLLASLLMPSRPPISLAPIKIGTPFVMKPQATLSSRVRVTCFYPHKTDALHALKSHILP
jgi:hypothetical protein